MCFLYIDFEGCFSIKAFNKSRISLIFLYFIFHHRLIYDFLSLPLFLSRLKKERQVFVLLDRLRSSVKLSCNQLFLDVFKVVDHTLPGLVSTAD